MILQFFDKVKNWRIIKKRAYFKYIWFTTQGFVSRCCRRDEKAGKKVAYILMI
jgi:hypothetical protein